MTWNKVIPRTRACVCVCVSEIETDRREGRIMGDKWGIPSEIAKGKPICAFFFCPKKTKPWMPQSRNRLCINPHPHARSFWTHSTSVFLFFSGAGWVGLTFWVTSLFTQINRHAIDHISIHFIWPHRAQVWERKRLEEMAAHVDRCFRVRGKGVGKGSKWTEPGRTMLICVNLVKADQ